jgi:hypothetical protein
VKPLQFWKQKGLEIVAWPSKNGGVQFSLKKSYKDKQTNEWKETKTYFENDLETLAGLITNALAWQKGGRDTIPQAGDIKIPEFKLSTPKAESLAEDDIPF